MEQRINPFASPASDLAPSQVPYAAPAAPRANAWQSQGLLIVTVESRITERCVKCNEPSSTTVKKTFYWHHPAVYLSVLISILIYIILALVLRKSMTLEFGLCSECAAKRSRNIWIGVGLMLFGVASFIFGIAMIDHGGLAHLGIWPGLLAFLVGAIVMNSASYVLAAKEIDERFAKLKKAGSRFLDSLPHWG